MLRCIEREQVITSLLYLHVNSRELAKNRHDLLYLTAYFNSEESIILCRRTSAKNLVNLYSAVTIIGNNIIYMCYLS